MRKRALSMFIASLLVLSGCQSDIPSEATANAVISEVITTTAPLNLTETTTTTAETELTTTVTEETQSPEEYYTELYYTAVPMPKASDCIDNFEQIKSEAINYNELSENIEALLRKNAVCCEFFVHGGKFTSVDGDDVIAPDEVFICESELFPDFGSLKDFTNSVYTEECTTRLMDLYKLYDYGNGEIRKIGTGPIWSVNIMSAENLYAITEIGTDYCNFVCFWDSYVPMSDEEIPDDYKQYTVTEHTAVRVNGEWRLSEMVNDLANNRFHLRIDKTPVWTAPNGEVLYLEDAYEVSNKRFGCHS